MSNGKLLKTSYKMKRYPNQFNFIVLFETNPSRDSTNGRDQREYKRLFLEYFHLLTKNSVTKSNDIDVVKIFEPVLSAVLKWYIIHQAIYAGRYSRVPSQADRFGDKK